MRERERVWELHFANIQLSSMKFERQRSGQGAGDKYELSNQEFLTFRNSPVTENSGRTVYSQQFDYRSLDRYDKPEEKAEPAYNFRKNMKNLRSQDKYRQLKEQALLFPATEENSESQLGSERREQQKARLAKLMKRVKLEQKKEALLREQTEKLEREVKELQEANCTRREGIEQLQLILRDNEKNIDRMKRRLDAYIAKEQDLEENLDSLKAKESEAKTNRNNEQSQRQKQLIAQMERSEQQRQQLQNEIDYLVEEIECMKQRMLEMAELDEQLRLLASK